MGNLYKLVTEIVLLVLRTKRKLDFRRHTWGREQEKREKTRISRNTKIYTKFSDCHINYIKIVQLWFCGKVHFKKSSRRRGERVNTSVPLDPSVQRSNDGTYGNSCPYTQLDFVTTNQKTNKGGRGGIDIQEVLLLRLKFCKRLLFQHSTLLIW